MDGIVVIDQPGLRERVAAELERAILLGKLPAGTRLVEAEIAARMGISKTPVREALLSLEQSGLVRLMPRRGAIVASVSLQLIDEIFALREVIECYAVEQALPRLTADDFVELAQRVDQLAEVVCTHPDDYHLISDHDLAFHEHLYIRSENSLLLNVWRLLRSRMRMVHAFTRLGSTLHQTRSADAALPGETDTVVERHRAYLDVLRRGDVAHAIAATRRHLSVGHTLARRSYADLCADQRDERR